MFSEAGASALIRDILEINARVTTIVEVLKVVSAAHADNTVPGLSPAATELFDTEVLEQMREHSIKVHRAAVDKALSEIAAKVKSWNEYTNPIK